MFVGSQYGTYYVTFLASRVFGKLSRSSIYVFEVGLEPTHAVLARKTTVFTEHYYGDFEWTT